MDARIDFRNVVRTAGLEKHSVAGIAQDGHQRQNILLKQRLATRDLDKGTPKGRYRIHNLFESLLFAFVKRVLGIAIVAAKIAEGHTHKHARSPLVEITGGEPLLQKNVLPLMSILCDTGYTVLLETSGAHDISKVDPRVHRIMDLKTPGSGEVDKNLWLNIDHLTLRDEVKFVMGSREDYEWSRDKVQRYDLPSRCHAVLFSPIFGSIYPC